jgi:hypothetical protein
VAFSVDGQVVATLQAPAANASGYAVYLSNNGATPLVVDELHVAPPYAAAGIHTSCILDSTTGGWSSVAWSADVPAATGLTLETRTSEDTVNWSAWAALAGSGAAPAQQGRYLQYRALFNSANATQSPRLDAVTVAPSGATVSALDASAANTTLPELWGVGDTFLPLITQ